MRGYSRCAALGNALVTFAWVSRWGHADTRRTAEVCIGDAHPGTAVVWRSGTRLRVADERGARSCTAHGQRSRRYGRSRRPLRGVRAANASTCPRRAGVRGGVRAGKVCTGKSRASEAARAPRIVHAPRAPPPPAQPPAGARPSHPTTARAPRPAPSPLKGPRPPPRFLPRGPPPLSPRCSGPWYAPRGGGGGRRGSRERAGGARPGRPPRLQAAGPGPLPCGLGDAGAAFPGWMRPPAAGRGVTRCGLPACTRSGARLAPPARAAAPRAPNGGAERSCQPRSGECCGRGGFRARSARAPLVNACTDPAR